MRTDWITLVKTEATDTTFQQLAPVSGVSCWAEKKSVARSEFYGADAAGRVIDAVFEVSPIDYVGQEQLVHHTADGDIEYQIVRDYKLSNRRDSIELSCSRIAG